FVISRSGAPGRSTGEKPTAELRGGGGMGCSHSKENSAGPPDSAPWAQMIGNPLLKPKILSRKKAADICISLFLNTQLLLCCCT
ncbi:hypothetical protein GOODEAATRI_008167, partial [Goodea atripinnis]